MYPNMKHGFSSLQALLAILHSASRIAVFSTLTQAICCCIVVLEFDLIWEGAIHGIVTIIVKDISHGMA
jgi:hypothetical protein